MKNKNVIITGVLGQDGSYLSELLLEEGYDVCGIYKRNSSGNNFENIKYCINNPKYNLIEGDILEYSFIQNLINEKKPIMFFNLAAQSHVGYSFKTPTETFRINAEAVINMLDSIRIFSPETRFYQASTSEMCGGTDCPKDGYRESFSYNPRSPYAVSKVAAHLSVKNYREAYGLFAVAGILFNHGSERRALDFATRKITNTIAKIKLGKETKLRMGDMSSYRDEGHAKDYVKAQYLMLKQESPKDYVIATGQTASIKEMAEYVCSLAGLSYDDIYEQDERFMRPSDVPYLKGNPESAFKDLNWKPEHNWKSLLKLMYENDLKIESGGK